jgi:hypothetical protein
MKGRRRGEAEGEQEWFDRIRPPHYRGNMDRPPMLNVYGRAPVMGAGYRGFAAPRGVNRRPADEDWYKSGPNLPDEPDDDTMERAMYQRRVMPGASMMPDMGAAMQQLPTRGGMMPPAINLPAMPNDPGLLAQMTPLLGMLGARQAANQKNPPTVSDDPSMGSIMGLLRGLGQPGGFLGQFSSSPWQNVGAAYNLSNIF